MNAQTPRWKKISDGLNKKVNSIELTLIPHRIKSNCIIKAKTNQSKEKLVEVAVQAAFEQSKRTHVYGYEYFVDKKNNHKDQGFFALLWDEIKGLFNK
jgi:hypothetical protein